MNSYVEFPNLGLKFNINDGIQITDEYSIKWYGVIICFAFIFCVFLGIRSCEKHGISKDDLLDYILITVPSAIIGARIYYVAFSWDSYKDNWTDIFRIWNGGLAIYGGVIAVVIAVIIVSKIKKKSFLKILDFALPYIILGQAIGRWGNFINQEAYGSSTTLPWGMTGDKIAQEFGAELVHPAFLYESLWCFAAFAVMMVLRKHLHERGQMTAFYMVFYGAERTLVEGLRTDSLMLGSIRVSQWLSAILCICGIIILIYLSRKQKLKLDEAVADDDNSISRLVRSMKIDQSETEVETEQESELESQDFINSEETDER